MAAEIPKEILEKASRVIGEMMVKTVQDEDFRKLALKDFAAAYKQHTGDDFPEGANMRFVEPGQGDPQAGLYELPDVTEELSDEDLEQVAGGLVTATGGAMPTAMSIAMVYGAMPPSVSVGGGKQGW